MELLNKFSKYFFAVVIGALLSGCGVKGMPLPPLTPAPLGRGEPTYSETTKKSSKDKKKYKNEDLEETPASDNQEGL
ncbi:lipoprotein [Bdellovibrio svalbardensis]|uniref:Lipoprotein n=1 Tax=Bdellovibrio svalbardensis TaxID=2972972 RepID=A0ABT6DG11_9BACT|nr:lipoprotein [Bdellovibrio svalbardensis]MDG0814879.1 lipoprotein [Bdellovibrio svalbardensis]